MCRSKHIRASFGWSQGGLATFLGVSQVTVSRLDAGARESGPIARLFDQLEAALAHGLVASDATPEQALAALTPRAAFGERGAA